MLILGLVELASFLIPANDSNRPMLSITVLLAMYFSQNEVLLRLPITKGDVLLGSYVLQMSIFTSTVAITQLVMLFIATTFNVGKKVCCNKKMAIVRFLDFIIFLTALTAFGAIHLLVLVKLNYFVL